MTPPSNASLDEQDQESHPSWLNPFNWPVGIWVLLIAAFVMLLPFGIRTLMLAGIPAMDEPFDVTEFVKWDVPPDEDAFTDYRLAAGLRERIVAEMRMQSQREPEIPEVVYEQGWAAADEPLKQWLELHREALTIWRRGTEKQRGLNLAPDKMAFDSVLNTVQELRTFVRLALLEEARCIHEGQLDEAWRWTRAANRCGGHATHRGCIIQGMVGAAIHAMSTKGMARWAEQPGVTSDQLRAALAEVKSDHVLYEPQSNMLKSEYLAARNTLRSPRWMGIVSPVTSVNPNSEALAVAMKMGYWVRAEPELTIRVYRQVLANQILEVDKLPVDRRKTAGSGQAMLFDPNPAVPLIPGQLDPAGIDKAFNRSMLARMLMPAAKSVESALLREMGRQAAIEALLAAQTFRRDHDEFPETLSQLVPDYIDAVPLDPCNPVGGPLLYRRDEAAKAVIWSVGADGNDGGGSVDAPNGRPADTGFILK